MHEKPFTRVAGKRILVVEDEYLIAEDLVHHLSIAGAEVVGPVATVANAIECIESGGLHCAIVDMNLRGERAFPVLDQLILYSVPTLIVTGYNAADLPTAYQGITSVEKPVCFARHRVGRAVDALIAASDDAMLSVDPARHS